MKQLRDVTAMGGRYPMGLAVTRKNLHISAKWAGESCSLVLFEKGAADVQQKFAMDPKYRQGDVWNLTLESDGTFPVNLEYCLELDGEMTADPYGRAILGWEQWGDPGNPGKALRCPVWEDKFDWEGDAPLNIPYEECVIYKAHVRGLTKHTSSKVREKGTFKAVIEKIPYLKELGITTLELMPVMEFEEVVVPEGYGRYAGMGGAASRNANMLQRGGAVRNGAAEQDEAAPAVKLNYWGYEGGYYFAPKASYSSGRIKNPVKELKLLVKELHKAGIELVLEMYFKGTEDPGFVLDVVRYWVQEYHLDGVHLVGYPPVQLIGQDPYLSRTKILANSWDGVKKGSVRHLAECNDGFLVDMRRFLKGDEGQLNNLVMRSRRNPADEGVINYMANTNGFTMADMVSYDVKKNEANGENNQDGTDFNYSWNCGLEGPTKKKKIMELRRKQVRNAALMLFLSQGTPLWQAGDEFGNSQMGNNNAYCQDNEITWLNWNLTKADKEYQNFVKECIAFRKAHPVFHRKQELLGMDSLGCGHPDVSYHGEKAWQPQFENFRRELGVMYCGEYGKRPDGSSDDYFFVVYNMHWEPHELGLPKLPKNRRWHLVVDTGDGQTMDFAPTGKEPQLEDQLMYQAAPRSVAVLIGKVDPELEKELEKAQKKVEEKKRRGKQKKAETSLEKSEKVSVAANQVSEL